MSCQRPSGLTLDDHSAMYVCDERKDAHLVLKVRPWHYSEILVGWRRSVCQHLPNIHSENVLLDSKGLEQLQLHGFT